MGIMQYVGKGSAVDFVAARLSFERACSLGDARGCGNAAGMHLRGVGAPKHAGKALAYAQRACGSGDAVGCYNLGLIHRYRADGKVDQDQAKAAFTKGCRMAHKQACDELRKGTARGDAGAPVKASD